MSFNVKKKVMLALLAGGMLCANSAFAASMSWYGTAGGFVTSSSAAAKTGVNLVITDSTIVEGKDVSFPKAIYGGYNFDGSGSVTGNSITFNTTLTIKNDAVIYGGQADDNPVTGNEVKIRNGNFGSNVILYGGYSGNGNANENKVEVSGGTFGLGSKIYGGYSGSGDANNNKVYFEGGSIPVESAMLYIYGGYSGGGTANGNEIYILGDSEFNNYLCVIGGNGNMARGNNVYIGNEDATTVFNNLKFQQLAGGTSSSGIDGTGNVLHVRTAKCSVLAVGGFDTVNFTLPASIQNNDTILTDTAMLVVDQVGGTATINVKAANGVKLKAGDVITLVDVSDPGLIEDYFVAGDILGGAAELCVEKDDTEDKNGDSDQNDLVITLLRDFEQKAPTGSEDQQKAPVEGIAAGVAMINQSADLASGEGMQNLLQNTGNSDTENNIGTEGKTAFNNINTFGAVTGSRTKYKTGSHVDMDGWGFLVGVGTTKEWTHAGKTTYGIFFEYGKGDFDTYNNNIHGEGESVNRGAGIMARQTLNNNTYYDGIIRYGKQKTDWSETEIGGYNTDSKYYGITVGMGHIYKLNEGRDEIDIYGRYTYGHVGGSDATVGEKEYHFDTVKSNRVRVGGKYNFNVNKGKETVKPYVGLAWEHEFSGECKAGISDAGRAPAPRFKGHTGIVEAGINWEANKNMQLGIGAEAYLGKRKGWSGMVNMLFNF